MPSASDGDDCVLWYGVLAGSHKIVIEITCETSTELVALYVVNSRAIWMHMALKCVRWGCLSLVLRRADSPMVTRAYWSPSDEIDYTGPRDRQASVIGGAGTYAAIGARLVAGAEHSNSVGWIVDMGSDFPIEFRQRIESWSTSCLFREDTKRLTTRAWNGYGPGDHRGWCSSTQAERI
jgi:hypothetical protein